LFLLDGGKEAPQGYGPIPIMFILTDQHHGFVYSPDQLVVVFAEGFQPNENLSVSVVHESDGIIKSDLGQTNLLGQMIIYHDFQETPDDPGACPDGSLSFQVSGDQGTKKSYTFFIDHSIDVQRSPISGCGVYPPPPPPIWVSPGWGLALAEETLRYRPERRRIVLVIHDGEPVYTGRLGNDIALSLQRLRQLERQG
jgi:hypothetical protein